MDNNWKGLLRIIEAQYIVNGDVIWEVKNLKNTLHTDGHAVILNAAFLGIDISNFYFGLDNRSIISTSDTLASLSGEPSGNGYSRINLPPGSSYFTGATEDGVYSITSSPLSFTASGGTYGPVNNLFMTNTTDDSGSLISTVPLTRELNFADGATFTMRMGISLADV